MDELPLPHSAKPGTLIRGKYRVERMLGEGGVGVVVEATHLSINKRVAIKLLRPEWQTEELEARFEREARVAAGLPADHIAQVTDAGHTEAGECFLVMELLVGQDLADELGERGRLPIPEAVELILQAMMGVAEAHAAGLVHRDLKPANLFLVKQRGGRVNVKVLDFGLSKAPLREGETELTQTTSNFGTPQYMSPEQLQSAKHVDARSDQHALAMILFELCTGRLPYEAPSLTSLTIAIATEPPPSALAFCSEMPEALDRAIRRALAKRPDQRFPDVLAFARAIAPFAGERAHESLESIAAALAFKAVPQSAPEPLDADDRRTPVRMSAPRAADDKRKTVRMNEARAADDKRKTVPMSAPVDDDMRKTMRMAVDDDMRKTVRMAALVDEPGASRAGREPLPSTTAPRRSRAQRGAQIAGIVTLALLAIGLGAWAMGWLEPLSWPTDGPPGAPAPSAGGAGTPAGARPSEDQGARPLPSSDPSSATSAGKSPHEVLGDD